MDYVEVPAGSTSVGIDIIPIPDTFIEDDETIIFSFPFVNECVNQGELEVSN